MRRIFGLVLLVVSASCKNEISPKVLKNGSYRALLQVQDGYELPFIFEVEAPKRLRIFNAEEVIEVDEIDYRNDSVFITTPVFEGYFAAVFEGDNLKGQFIKESRDHIVPFSALFNSTERFTETSTSNTDVSGVWETVFSPNIEGDEYIAKGIFEQKDGKVTGTFRTETGDYRYLEGVMSGDSLKLSTFDGAHAFLFVAKVKDASLEGMFYSENHFKEPFIAKRNANYELPSADALTYLKEGYDSLAFSFPDAQGNMVSLSDERFKGKVVVVQVMGTWCPNCLDESKYYTQFYKANKDKGFEIVALAFEYAKTEAKAFDRIARLTSGLEIDYPVLLAQYGGTDKEDAQKKLPMLNRVLSYPTSIFIDKTGKVRKIHTGFNGPATGDKYIEFTTEFEDFVNQLLDE
ncbi:TlpA family protein disulfide reductase [Winogradskyella sp. DF17]|uniref:TlpA family protein disulfide reductase n=1 Tax=Winogradskyella pelagia TaxID=2819984 RepID=A0ABS3T172_9FLAO|nr:TlpA disulfide reductase family protein [Winogradskyella sp. DF17]MBO3116495.1 TlpA family protein disulfide reductase [Winogradskyella sp. DF17]